ncbi:MAG: ADP-ribosylglycohydrolase family protein [Ardenticatenales bacterium]|nr:ADP-ribosylglycohydrolase family protein [Ardenticatenales bacterium]
MPPIELIDVQPPQGYARAHAGAPPGTWSDDGAQALALRASLLEQGQLDEHDLARRLVAWHTKGDMAVDNHVFDMGNQTRRAIDALADASRRA